MSSLVTLNTCKTLPLVGLGTYKLSGQDLDVAVRGALEIGYRLFDTAKVYGNEKDLGSALESNLEDLGLMRADISIITKIYIKEGETAKKVREDVEDSLKKLKISYIDVVLIHYPRASESANDDDGNADMRKEAYMELEKLRDEGLIHSVGVSNYEINHIKEIKLFSQMLPCLNQIEFHPHFTRQPLVDYCRKHGIFIQAFSSLVRHTPTLIDAEKIKHAADKHNCSSQEILLAWATSQGIGIIPKSSSVDRLKSNWIASQIKLSEEEVNEISSLNIDKNYVRCTGWLVK